MTSRSRADMPTRCVRGPGGMRVLLKENHSSPIAAVAAYYLGGSRAESSRRHGITHFVQRMLLKGTARRSAEEIAEEFEFLGASFSPLTSKDVFGATLTLLSRNFAAGLSLFAECLLEPAFLAAEVEKERRNILAEIRRRRDDPLGFALQNAEEVLYRRHPYRFPIGGVEATVERLGQSSLREWHRRIHSPDRLVLCVVGDLRALAMRDRIQEVFAGFEPSGFSLPVPAPEPPRPRPYTRRLPMDRRQAAVAMAFSGPSFPSREHYAFDVLNHVLGGMSGRLFENLRDRKGLAYVVNSSFQPRLDGGFFGVYLGTAPESRARARRALLDELRRLGEELVTTRELHRAKKYLLGLHEIALQRKSVQASRLAFHEVMGAGHETVRQHQQKIREVTAEDVLRVARRYLRTKAYACAEVVP